MECYLLQSDKYTIGNALNWGLCRHHWNETQKETGSLGSRIIHLFISTCEFLPIVSQIVSIFELSMAHLYGKINIFQDSIFKKTPTTNTQKYLKSFLLEPEKSTEKNIKKIKYISKILFSHQPQRFIDLTSDETKTQKENELDKVVNSFLDNRTIPTDETSQKNLVGFLKALDSNEQIERFSKLNKDSKEILNSISFYEPNWENEINKKLNECIENFQDETEKNSISLQNKTPINVWLSTKIIDDYIKKINLNETEKAKKHNTTFMQSVGQPGLNLELKTKFEEFVFISIDNLHFKAHQTSKKQLETITISDQIRDLTNDQEKSVPINERKAFHLNPEKATTIDSSNSNSPKKFEVSTQPDINQCGNMALRHALAMTIDAKSHQCWGFFSPSIVNTDSKIYVEGLIRYHIFKTLKKNGVKDITNEIYDEKLGLLYVNYSDLAYHLYTKTTL